MPTKKTKPVKKPVPAKKRAGVAVATSPAKPAKPKMMMTGKQANKLSADLEVLSSWTFNADTIERGSRDESRCAKRMVSVANALLKHAGAR